VFFFFSFAKAFKQIQFEIKFKELKI